MFGRSAAETVRQEGAAFTDLIRDEISLINEQQKSLPVHGKAGYATILILSTCIIFNVIAFVSLHDYLTLFIAASLYLHMIYFITLIVPIGRGTLRFPTEEAKKFFAVFQHTGVIMATDRFTRILLDVFFINSRTLFFAILCLFSFDILFTFIGFAAGMFSLMTILVILFQLLAFLIFYFLVWRLRPGSARFREGVNGLKGAFATKQYPPWLTGVMFGTFALLVLLLILSTIILLPGVTVQAFLSLSGISGLSNLFVLLGIIAASQYFIVRFLHGTESARMAETFSDNRIRILQSAGHEWNTEKTATASTDPYHAAEALLETRIYRLELRTIAGAFPVWLVNPDFSVIFDEDVIAAITGFVKGAAANKEP